MIEFIGGLLVGGLILSWLGVVLIGPPYVPTLKRDIDKVLAVLKIGKSSHFVDLGSGDGRVLSAAAKLGSRISGVEINPFLVAVSWWRLRHFKSSVKLGNLWGYRLPDDTTHVFIFAADIFMNKLEKYLASEREHTGRFWLVCYGFKFKDREPDNTVGTFNMYQF